jgi:5-(carboxyamino)imidazole ribonucleotide mutase
MPKVAVVIGSKTDESLIKPGLELLEQLSIDYEYLTLSAHRNPEKIRDFAVNAKGQGIELIIAAAGAAAHLPGVIASWTTLPVIGIPLPTSDLKGVDSLYSIVQMPGGVPVACVGIGSAGVKNAVLLAAQMLGIKYDNIKKAFEEYKQKIAKG